MVLDLIASKRKINPMNFQLSDLYDRTFGILAKVWHFTIFSVEQRPITIANIVLAIVLLVVGHRVAKRSSDWISRQLIDHINVTLAQRATIRTVVFYLVFLFVSLIALNIANFPLTAFTLLGGAVAIGVGFGSQNIVNNFISGIILMLEQPVKVGDIIEMDGLRGVVEHIGARSTRIRSYMNTHIIVPNSAFLEKNVLNWTLADDVVRIAVNVGVAYGSPTEKVRELLLEAINEEPKALSRPEPIVLFDCFGDSSLVFNVYFGVKLKNHMERMTIESNLRFRIDQKFRDNDIVIAFPQRDIHLSQEKPFRVEISPR